MSLLANIPLAIVNNIGFVAILLGIYQCIKLLTEKGVFKLQPANLFSIATLFQTVGLIHFIISILVPVQSAGFMSSILYTGNNLLANVWNQNSLQWLSLLGFIYCIVLLFIVGKTILQFFSLMNLQKTANYSNTDEYISLLPTTHHHEQLKNIKIGTSSNIEAPISFGWLQPVILLPISICNQLTMKEMEAILLHEMAHILRNDYVINIFISFTQVVLFFNPFTNLFNKEISLQREMACDRYVVSAAIDKLDYLNALYKIANLVSGNIHSKKFLSLSVGFLNTPNELLDRVRNLTHTNVGNKTLFTKLILASSIGALLFFVSYTNNANKELANKSTYNRVLVAANNSKTINFKNSTSAKNAIANRNTQKVVTENKTTTDNNTATNAELLSSKAYHKSYNELVQKTVQWIKAREVTNKFVNFQEDQEAIDFDIAEKMLMRAIFSNYQLKRDLLNDRLGKATNEKEAMDYVMNSKEWEQIQQYEKWTNEFLKKHPHPVDSTTQAPTRLIVY